MTVLQTFLEGVWKLVWRGDGVLGHWPNEDYDMELVRNDDGSIFVQVTNDTLTKSYHVKLEEIK